MFTKLLKPVYFILRQRGHELIGSGKHFIQGDTKDSCFSSGKVCIQLPRSLEFVIHPQKSVLAPSQTLELLAFIMNSATITVSLTEVKKMKIKENCWLLRENKQPTVREVANEIGLLVSVLPCCAIWPLYYRHLQHVKFELVKQNKSNFDKHMTLSSNALQELKLWEQDISLQ